MSRKITVKLTKRLVDAGADFFYLLERGYNRKPALDMVTARWQLSKVERMALYRCVFDAVTSRRRIGKLTERTGVALAIDGFNVLSTIRAALIGDSLLKSTDGFVRDLSATLRKVKVDQLTTAALSLMLLYVERRIKPSKLLVVFDSQVSKSGILASIATELIGSLDLEGEATLSRSADVSLQSLANEYVIATSDSVIIDRVSEVMDLGGMVCRAVSEEKIIDLGKAVLNRVMRIAESIAQRVSEIDEKNGCQSKRVGM